MRVRDATRLAFDLRPGRAAGALGAPSGIPPPASAIRPEFGDYFSRPVDESSRGGCPYTLDLDTLSVPEPALGAQRSADARALVTHR